MIYDVPEKYSFAKSYLNSLGTRGVIPTDFYFQELLMLNSFFGSDFPKQETSYELYSCFPSDFIELVHKLNGQKIEVYPADMTKTRINRQKNPVILTEHCALSTFTIKHFDNFIKDCEAKIFYVCGTKLPEPRRVKINGSYINGVDFREWKKLRTSHLHMGIKRTEIENFVVEEW